jgi:ribonucleoside-diphosphate reductase alpha chain
LNHSELPKGLLNTPPLPDDLPIACISENALKVLERRYIRRGENGKPIETVSGMFWRVAYHIAKVEETWETDVISRAREYYQLLSSKRFFPNSPTFTGAGTPLGQLAACFVLPISDDMGRESSGIFQTLRDAALIQQTGGGNGFTFSRLRPAGTLVKSSAGNATGPIGFLRVYDQAFGEVAQGGSRRGANMAVLRVDHPDIEDFISCKTTENAITNFNISVGITDKFMQAVENDDWWDLRFPDVLSPDLGNFDGTLDEADAMSVPVRLYGKVRASTLFQKIVKQAHHNGEPGMLFLDTANRDNPVPHLYQLEATNPCGEQWLGPYENCCLGSINLAQHMGPDGSVEWEELRQTVTLATRFLDDVVDANGYVPAVPALKEAALNARRIGLGIMGLGDLMYHVRVRYGSSDGQELAGQVMEYVRYHAMLTSIALAQERGSFPAIIGSIYDPEDIKWDPPAWPGGYKNNWGRPELDWQKVTDGIRAYGIRNAAQTTIAPTGTIATVAGIEGYGCEPVFALAYIRHVNDNGKDLELVYTSPMFEKALTDAGLKTKVRQNIIEEVMEVGTCQQVGKVPEELRQVFAVSQDITAEEHVRMQAALQRFVDNSLSKTINFPENAAEEEVATAFQLAWKLGCKGITVYITGSREKVVLETHSTAVEKTDKEGEAQLSMWQDIKKPRPAFLTGFTHSIDTPLGKAFITINENGGYQPFEIFLNTAKAGSDTAAVSEAIGRLISYVLRISSPVEPAIRMVEVIRQLAGIGGGRPLGFGPNRVRSLPDGVAQVLDSYLTTRDERMISVIEVKTDNAGEQNGSEETDANRSKRDQPFLKIGDLCPDCGQAAFVSEEGCRKCYACGYSEC